LRLTATWRLELWSVLRTGVWDSVLRRDASCSQDDAGSVQIASRFPSKLASRPCPALVCRFQRQGLVALRTGVIPVPCRNAKGTLPRHSLLPFRGCSLLPFLPAQQTVPSEHTCLFLACLQVLCTAAFICSPALQSRCAVPLVQCCSSVRPSSRPSFLPSVLPSFRPSRWGLPSVK